MLIASIILSSIKYSLRMGHGHGFNSLMDGTSIKLPHPPNLCVHIGGNRTPYCLSDEEPTGVGVVEGENEHVIHFRY